MNIKIFRYVLIISLLIFATLACKAIPTIFENMQSARETAKVAGTQVKELVTQAIGAATEFESSGILETAQAFATQEASKLLATGQALATKVAESGYIQTAQAKVTEGFNVGEAPPDIPLVDEDTIVNFFGSDDLVSYFTSTDLETVKEFYLQEMVKLGWDLMEEKGWEYENTLGLEFEKTDRSASVTITINPMDKKTIVVILIQEK